MKSGLSIARLVVAFTLVAAAAVRGGELPEVTVFSIGNLASVTSGPTAPSVFTTGQDWRITGISTYHWNNGLGATPGTLSLSEAGGATYGPWATTGRAGLGGVPNAYWDAAPNVILPPGTYTVVDSEPSTWSQNSASAGRGFVVVKGRSQFDFPSDGSLVAALHFSVNGDPRVMPVVWTAPTPEGVVDAQIVVPASALQEGKNRLTFGAVGEAGMETGPWATTYVQRLPFDHYTAGTVALAVNKDPAQSPDLVQAVTPPSTSAEVSLTLPSGLTLAGLNHLHLRIRDPAGFWGPMVIAPLVQSPNPDLRITEIAMAVNADPMGGFAAHVTGADLGEVSLDLPPNVVPDGVQRVMLRARDQNGNWGPMLVTPVVGEVVDPLLAAGRVSHVQMRVLNAAGLAQAGPYTAALTPPILPLDDVLAWPTLRLRFSGSYRLIAAALTENGFPGPFMETSFQHRVPPFVASMNENYWPPEAFPDVDLGFSGDTNRDGVANGTAFAFGADSEEAVASRLPVPFPDGADLVMTFRQREGGAGTPGLGYTVDGVRYMIEYSTNLIGPWIEATAIAAPVGSPVPNGDGTATATVRLLRPSGSPAVFARLRVRLLP